MNERLIHENEKVYFIICVAISALIYLGLILSIIGIFYILIGVLITVFLHGISMGHIRNNGVKLTDKQFPEINARAKEIAMKMGIQSFPDIYIVESGSILNAFATRFFGRNFIILYSDIVEVVKSGHHEELNFIIAHELAHIQRKHLTKNLLILPAVWVPFLGKAYSKACEYTCDRIAAAYVNNTTAAINSMAILAVGKALFTQLDIEEYVHTAKNETGFFIWLSHVLSTHPPLPKRIMEIQKLSSFPEMYGMRKLG